MNPETIQESMRLWQKDPSKAKAKPIVKGYSDGTQVVLETGTFSWRSDLPAVLGGTNAAPSPSAMFLGALAGCAVALIRDTLAPQLGVHLESVEAIVQCDTDFQGLLGVEGAVPDFQNMQITIRIQSSDSEETIKRLYQVWQERCPIYLALTKPVPVNTALEIKA